MEDNGFFSIVECFIYYDGPLLFTFREGNDLRLAYWYDIIEKQDTYLVVPITQENVEALKNNTLSLYGAINQPTCWQYAILEDGTLSISSFNLKSIPRENLPDDDVMVEWENDQ
jgi:hypothetical protein